MSKNPVNVEVPFTVKPKMVYKMTAIKRDAEGNEISRRESEEIPNVFTNWGVESLYGQNGENTSLIAAAVGTGSTATAMTDTVLQSFLAGKYSNTTTGQGLIARTFVDQGSSVGYVQVHWRTIFATGTATGNISEVGAAFLGSNPISTTKLFSRALVVDGGGNPTTFTVLADEELQLDQFFRVYVNYADQSAVINVNGTNYTCTWRPLALGDPSNWWPLFGSAGPQNTTLWSVKSGTLPMTLAAANGSGTPTSNGSSYNSADSNLAAALNAYTANSKQRSTYIQFKTGLTVNIAGIVYSTYHGSWQVSFNPVIPKSSLERFTATMLFKIDNTP